MLWSLKHERNSTFNSKQLIKGSSCSEQTIKKKKKALCFIYGTQTDKKDGLHDLLRLQ